MAEFLGKHAGRHVREVLDRKAVSDALKKHAGVDIAPEKIAFSGAKAEIKGLNSAERSAIFVNKPAIISAIAKAAGRKITDIK